MKKILLIILTALSSPFVQAQNHTDWLNLKENINLFVANDLGRNGYYDQRPVAALMGEMAETVEPEAILALGDIFHYMGVQSTADPLWTTNYESIYTHPELMVEWLPVCGNHEYRGDTRTLIAYSYISRRWVMPAKYYARTFKGKTTSIKILLIDTSPLIDKYRNDTASYPDASSENMDAQLAWLEKELATATEDWIIVAGHHPIFAATLKSKSERTDMQARVDQILRRYRVDMYLCGHIHNFQHIKQKGSDIDYIVNSSASQSRPDVKPTEGTVFMSGEPGFSVIGASSEALKFSMIDRNGNILYTVTRKK